MNRDIYSRFLRVLGSSALLTMTAAALCLTATGCAAQDSDVAAGDLEPEAISTGEARVVASVDVGYGQVDFIESTDPDGAKSISMSETSPNTFKETPLDAMQPTFHTHLEIFEAVAPDAPVPQELVAAHALEALALGRETDEIVPARFDKDMPIEKSDATCRAYVFADVPDTSDGCWSYDWIHKYSKNYTSGDATLYLNNSSSYSTTANVTLGICNESTSSITATISSDCVGDVGGWSVRRTLTAGANSRARWWNKIYVKTIPCDGFLCLDYYPVKYRIAADAPSGKSYYLAAADLRSNFHSDCVH